MSPPDADGHSSLSVEGAIAASKKASLDFVALTPHDADREFPAEAAVGAPAPNGQELMERLAAASATRGDLVVVAGHEFTRDAPGHLGITFARVRDLAPLAPERRAAAAAEKGGLVAVNHPFFRPVASDHPVMKLVEGDRRWRPFFGEGADERGWNAIEVWHERSVLVQKLHTGTATKFRDTQMAADALAAWDRVTKNERRRITAIGGSDCHGRVPYAVAPLALVSVLAPTRDAEGVRRGLLAAHATFGKDGGAAARDFTAASDVPGERAILGDALRAKREVRLAWEGRAVLVENGERVGEFDGGAVRRLDPEGAFAFWRIEKPGDAYSNMIYANLP